MSCATAGYSSGKQLAAELFPSISSSVSSCYENVQGEEENDFHWEHASDKNLFINVYLHDTLEVLAGDKAPALRNNFETYSKIKGVASKDLVTIIGCARYITGKNYRDEHNSFIAALKLYSGFNAKTQEILFQDFDTTYNSFAGVASKKEDKLSELAKREQEFAQGECSSTDLSKKLNSMSESEKSNPDAVWKFAQEIARSSYGVCEEFNPPTFWGGVMDYIGYHWRSLWNR